MYANYRNYKAFSIEVHKCSAFLHLMTSRQGRKHYFIMHLSDMVESIFLFAHTQQCLVCYESFLV